MEQKINLTKVYGISFMTDEEECKKVNETLANNESELFYIPRKFRMNIYFRNCVEASKVAKYFNEKQNGRYYHIFPTSLESLEHVKSLYEKDRKIKKHAPIMYHKLTGYRLYDTAENYFAALIETENSRTQSSQNEEDTLSQ